MKVTKIIPLVALCALMMVGCNKPAGELVGASRSTNFKEANPYGMLFIKKGSFMMGANTQSAVFEQPDNILMVTVDAFWMDETEITNNEYHQFVNWVRDSIAMTNLVAAGLTDYAIQPKDEDFDEENFQLNWSKKVPWKSKEEDVVDALAPMFYSNGTLNTNHLHYRYSWVNMDEALPQRNKFDVATSTYPPGATARVDTFWVNERNEIKDSTIIRPLREPKDLRTEKIISIYPDIPAAALLQQPMKRIVNDQAEDSRSQYKRHDMNGGKTQHQDESPGRRRHKKGGREKRNPLHGPEHQRREHGDEEQRYTRKPADLRLAPASRRRSVHGHPAHAVFYFCMTEPLSVDSRAEPCPKRHKCIRVVRYAALQRHRDEHMRNTVLFRGEDTFFQPPPRNGARKRSHKPVGKAKRVFRRSKQRRNGRRIILPCRCASKAATPLGGREHRRVTLGGKPGAAAAEHVKDRRHLVAGKTAAHRHAVIRRKTIGQRLGC